VSYETLNPEDYLRITPPKCEEPNKMKRIMNTTTRKDFRVKLTEDEVLDRIRSACSAPKDADVSLESDGSAVIRWHHEETSPAEA